MNKNESKYYNTALLMDEALIQLLEKKEFEYISIKEICEKAGVNRSTFYLHYDNTDDLLKETVETINKRFFEGFEKERIPKADVKSADKNNLFLITPVYLKPYLVFVRDNKKLYKLIHSKPDLFQSEKAFNIMYTELFQPILDKFEVKKENQPYVFEYYSKGLIAMIMKWVDLDFEKPIDELIEIITDTFSVYKKNEKPISNK